LARWWDLGASRYTCGTLLLMLGSLAVRSHRKRQLISPPGLLGVDRAVITPQRKIIYYQIPWEAKARLLPLVLTG
jgi:hypothetical protein